MIRRPGWLSALKGLVYSLWKREFSSTKDGSQGKTAEQYQPEGKDAPGHPDNIYPLW